MDYTHIIKRRRRHAKPMEKTMDDRAYMTMSKPDWCRLQEIIRRHPAALADLVAANLAVQQISVPNGYELISAPISHDLVNSADEVIATHPC